MIKISGNVITPESIAGKYPSGSIAQKIVDGMHSSSIVYKYDGISQLSFELDLRAGIINASRELRKSRFGFSTFRRSRCNTRFWNRSNEGGFRSRSDVRPLDAIRDIFINGTMYGSDCATAIAIIFYKAIADKFQEERFNSLFSSIYLMNWKLLDPGLGVRTISGVQGGLPGDCLYFKNPDVNPLTPWWQGENAIDLGDGTFYGHGIGITSAEGIIKVLNTKRKSQATISAYLLDTATRPGFKRLSDRYYSAFRQPEPYSNVSSELNFYPFFP